MRSPRLGCFAVSLLLAPVAVRAAAASEERPETMLRRPIAEMIALSPQLKSEGTLIRLDAALEIGFNINAGQF